MTKRCEMRTRAAIFSPTGIRGCNWSQCEHLPSSIASIIRKRPSCTVTTEDLSFFFFFVFGKKKQKQVNVLFGFQLYWTFRNRSDRKKWHLLRHVFPCSVKNGFNLERDRLNKHVHGSFHNTAPPSSLPLLSRFTFLMAAIFVPRPCWSLIGLIISPLMCEAVFLPQTQEPTNAPPPNWKQARDSSLTDVLTLPWLEVTPIIACSLGHRLSDDLIFLWSV